MQAGNASTVSVAAAAAACSHRNTIPDLVAANDAAKKSMVARRQGVERTVSTSVPDPQRLVPSVAPRAAAPAPPEPGWTCQLCRTPGNAAGRAECSRCGAPNPAHPRAAHASKDPLLCGEEEIVRAACEKHHPGINKAFLEAGTPWAHVRGQWRTEAGVVPGHAAVVVVALTTLAGCMAAPSPFQAVAAATLC